MREIKFRIWDGNKMHQPEHTNCSKKILNFKNNHHSNWIPMQFTGIRDKYGKEIYESDIVRTTIPESEYDKEYNIYGEIKFGDPFEGCFCFINNKFDYSQCLYKLSDVKKMGNIYEHTNFKI